MKKNTTEFPNLKQIEQLVWRQLQETFSAVMKTLLEDLDEQIAKERDKKRIVYMKSVLPLSSAFLEKSRWIETITVTEKKAIMSFYLTIIWILRGQEPLAH